jgi:hypothetical protein
MKTIIRQSNFAGGEIPPALYGRTDLQKYAQSLRRCRGFIVTAHGAVTNRPGTTFVREVKDSTKKVRLIPFIFGNDQSFVLEFGHQYIRFYKDGGIVLNAGNPYEVATPYTEADLDKLKFAQIGDIITITHSTYAPRELRRLGNTNWTLTTVDFIPAAHGIPYDLESSYDPDVKYTRAGYASIEYDIDQVVTQPKKERRYKLTLMLRNDTTRQVVETLPHSYGEVVASIGYGGTGTAIKDTTVVEWASGTAYSYTNVVRGSDGALYFCRFGNTGRDPTLKSNWASYWTPVIPGELNGQACGYLFSLAEHKPKISWGGVDAPSGYTLVGFRLYVGVRSGIYGLIADVDTNVRSFIDDGTTPIDYTRSPPTNDNPFASDYPACTGFFEQRRMMANTPLRPADLLGSKTGDFTNFAWKPVITDDDAITGLTLASMTFEEIRWLLPLRALLVGTSEGMWVISGSGGVNDALTASSFKARKQLYRGMSWIDPVAVDNAALVASRLNNAIYEVVFDYATDSYQSAEVSLLAAHLFDNHSIKGWAHARTPHSVVWMVRDDGILLGFSYNRATEVIAWHWHDTLGKFESICAVQEGNEDAVYVVVNRTVNGSTKRYVERFASRLLPRLEDGTIDVKRGVFLDSSLTYDDVPATIFSGLTHLEGMSVKVLADGAVFGPYTVTGGQIDISEQVPDGASVVTIGLSYTSEIETLDLMFPDKEIVDARKSVFGLVFQVIESRGLKVGGAYDALREWNQRTVADGYGTIKPFTGTSDVPFPSDYNSHGRVIVRVEDPLPVTIVGIGRKVDVGND